MTPEQLQAWKLAAEKATKGPWNVTGPWSPGDTYALGDADEVFADTFDRADADYLRQCAPENVIALIDELAEWRSGKRYAGGPDTAIGMAAEFQRQICDALGISREEMLQGRAVTADDVRKIREERDRMRALLERPDLKRCWQEFQIAEEPNIAKGEWTSSVRRRNAREALGEVLINIFPNIRAALEEPK